MGVNSPQITDAVQGHLGYTLAVLTFSGAEGKLPLNEVSLYKVNTYTIELEVFLMQIKGMPLGPIGTNCYIVYDNGNALLIDPGAEADKIKAFLEREGLQVQAILLTHAHFDHIAALDDIREVVDVDVYIHENELSWLSDPQMNGSYKLLGNEIVMKPAESTLKMGPMQIGDFTFEVIHTPGHSPGSVSFLFDQHEFIISGDVLFYHGIGRTDLPGGSMKEIEATIQHKLYRLKESFTVYPGHGPQTTIGEEKQNNPFVRA